MPEDIGWVIERRHNPGFIAGFRSGIAELSLDPLTITPRFAPESNFPSNRLNDAKADGQGRIWFGR
jgi:xylono-1,5-lactonase